MLPGNIHIKKWEYQLMVKGIIIENGHTVILCLYWYPHCFKVFIGHFVLWKIYVSTGFINQKKSKEDFNFYEERWKVKTALSVCFAVSCCRDMAYPGQWDWDSWTPPGTLSYACKHLCFIWIYFVHSLIKCVLR